MAAVDQRTIAEAGIPSAELIERAGAEVIAAIAAQLGWLGRFASRGPVRQGQQWRRWIAVARLLRAGGGLARVFLAADRADVQGAAAEHLRRCEQEGEAVEVLGEDLAPLDDALGEADLVIDALLGTGLRGAPSPAMARVIERVAHCERPVVAVDIPSGVEADTGQVHGAAVQAVLTVTFGLVKVGAAILSRADRIAVRCTWPISASPSPSCATRLPKPCCFPPRDWGRSCRVVVATSTREAVGWWPWSRGSVGMTGAAALTAGCRAQKRSWSRSF